MHFRAFCELLINERGDYFWFQLLHPFYSAIGFFHKGIDQSLGYFGYQIEIKVYKDTVSVLDYQRFFNGHESSGKEINWEHVVYCKFTA